MFLQQSLMYSTRLILTLDWKDCRFILYINCFLGNQEIFWRLMKPQSTEAPARIPNRFGDAWMQLIYLSSLCGKIQICFSLSFGPSFKFLDDQNWCSTNVHQIVRCFLRIKTTFRHAYSSEPNWSACNLYVNGRNTKKRADAEVSHCSL